MPLNGSARNFRRLLNFLKSLGNVKIDTSWGYVLNGACKAEKMTDTVLFTQVLGNLNYPSYLH